MVCLNMPCNFKLFKGCLPQILLYPYFHLCVSIDEQSSEAYLGPSQLSMMKLSAKIVANH